MALRFIAIVTLSFSAFVPRAQAILNEEEVSALSHVVSIYKKSKTVGEFYRKVDPYLDFELGSFLKSKMDFAEKVRLPQLDVRTDSKIALRVNGRKLTIDFTSLASDSLLIGGRELEFLAEDSYEVRFGKISKALQLHQGSASNLFVERAVAADDGGIPRERTSIVKGNLDAISSVVLAMQGAAKRTSTCDKINWPQANTACKRANLNFETSVGPSGDSAAAKVKDSKCSPTDEAALSPEQMQEFEKAAEKAPKQKGYLGKEYPNEEVLNNQTDPFDFPTIRELAKSKGLDLAMKFKLSQVQSYYQSAPKECQAALKECLEPFLKKIRERETSPQLRCYAARVVKDLDAKPAPGGSKPAAAPAKSVPN